LLVEGERLSATRCHCAVYRNALLSVRRARLGEAIDDRLLVGDVDMNEESSDRLSDFFAERVVDVEDGNLDAGSGERFGGGTAEAGCAPGHDSGNGRIDFHGEVPSQAGIWLNGMPLSG